MGFGPSKSKVLRSGGITWASGYEASGQTLEIRFRGRILGMLLNVAPAVRDWRAGAKGGTSLRFPPERVDPDK